MDALVADEASLGTTGDVAAVVVVVSAAPAQAENNTAVNINPLHFSVIASAPDRNKIIHYS
jgi:hypothetical protein